MDGVAAIHRKNLNDVPSLGNTVKYSHYVKVKDKVLKTIVSCGTIFENDGSIF